MLDYDFLNQHNHILITAPVAEIHKLKCKNSENLLV